MKEQIKIRKMPKTSAERLVLKGLLRLRLKEVEKRVKDLEEAQKISPEFLKTEINI